MSDTLATSRDSAAPFALGDRYSVFRRFASNLLALMDRRVGRSGALRLSLILLVHLVELVAVFYLAYELRWDFDVPDNYAAQRLALLAPIVACKMLMLFSFGQFRTIQSYFGLADFGGVFFSMATICGVMLALWFGAEVTAAPPRGVILIDFVMSVASISFGRLTLRVLRTSSAQNSAVQAKRIAIIGAGDEAEALAKDLLQRRGLGLVPVCMVDDDRTRIGRTVHGLTVLGPVEELPKFAQALGINELVIAASHVQPKRIKQIVELGRLFGANTQLVPSVTQLASGEVKVERSRPVAIEDLLGREPVRLDGEGIERLIRDKVVLVTGAGGSIGSELCRQVLRLAPRTLLIVDQAEIALFEIEGELTAGKASPVVTPLIADIADEASVRALLSRWRPQIIFHAAAHKHVPIMERQPVEALKNNTLATARLTRLASEYAVERFVFISTDKAINPTSVMGCSKRLAELALQSLHANPTNSTTFMAVRFGNVLGSSGSVIPVFRRQIAQGGPVTVTHPEMTRYFMTIPEAVGLVLQTATIGRGGEIFVLDMGEPVKIIDMARQMIELSGYKPDFDIEVKITGLRPGEKLYEELRHSEEIHEATEHPRIFKMRKQNIPDAGAWLQEVEREIRVGDAAALKALMNRIVPEYRPYAD